MDLKEVTLSSSLPSVAIRALIMPFELVKSFVFLRQFPSRSLRRFCQGGLLDQSSSSPAISIGCTCHQQTARL